MVGRSNIVGKPVAQLLLREDCTVTIAHSRTRDLPGVVRRADLVIAAVGRPEMVEGSWIKPGAIVIDVGINRIPAANGKTRLVGDVRFRQRQASGRRHHAGARRRRADDDRLPSAQYGGSGLRAQGHRDAGDVTQLWGSRHPGNASGVIYRLGCQAVCA